MFSWSVILILFLSSFASGLPVRRATLNDESRRSYEMPLEKRGGVSAVAGLGDVSDL